MVMVLYLETQYLSTHEMRVVEDLWSLQLYAYTAPKDYVELWRCIQ